MTALFEYSDSLAWYGDRAFYLRCVYGLRACVFFFKICHSAKLNKIVEAMYTMAVNPYDNRMVSLRRPHGKGDLDIVNSPEGKCNRGISK